MLLEMCRALLISYKVIIDTSITVRYKETALKGFKFTAATVTDDFMTDLKSLSSTHLQYTLALR